MSGQWRRAQHLTGQRVMLRPFPAGQIDDVTLLDRVRLAWRDFRYAATHRVLNAVPPGHFHSPVPALAELAARREQVFAARDSLPGIDLAVDEQLALARELAVLADQDLSVVDGPAAGPRYRIDNPYFHHADGIVYHLLLRLWQPARVVEVGAGYSTALLLDTADRCLERRPVVVSIEPDPRRLSDLLRPDDPVEIIDRPVQDVDRLVFEQLRPGDVLFIDSTHVSKTGSDVNLLLLEIVPSLPPGVFVHVHDMFFPDYPPAFVFGGMSWNEAYLVRALLVGNTSLRIRWWNSYLASRHADQVGPLLPGWGANGCSSLWLQKA